MIKEIYEKKVLRRLLLVGVLLFTAVGVAVFNNQQFSSKNLQTNLSVPSIELDAFPIVQPTTKYGFAVDTFRVEEGFIKPGMYFGDILQDRKISYPDVLKVVNNTKGIFDVSKLTAGKDYMILSNQQTGKAEYFVYEPNVYEYIVFDLKEALDATVVKRKVTTETNTASGVIKTSLWNTMMDNDMKIELAALLEDALQWSVDFHHIQVGDKFKVVYDEDFIDGKSVAIKKVYAAYFQNEGTDHYAIFYPNEDINKEGYYDLEGRPLNRGFLKAPIKKARISSPYNLRRFHPVLKRVKPHLGTDYAAPYGTPIYAVGSGTIDRIGYTKGNGNFIRIKHDDTYKTQYLHMKKFAKGMRKGKQVRQGQVIGYVGSTGLATGPHVCFRFWKNGRQVDHRRLKLPPAAPLPAEDLKDFTTIRDQHTKALKSVDYTETEAE